MQLKDHELSISFFDVGGGDAIWVRFWGNDSQWHHILIDGGYGYAYKNTFGPLIRAIIQKGESIDLWLISHIDQDHIGAVLGFTNDRKIDDKPAAVKQFWFNHDIAVHSGNGKLAVHQGVSLRKYLKDHDLLLKEAITVKQDPVDLFGLRLTILSPTPEKQNHATELWKAKERAGKLGRTAAEADHGKTIEELAQNIFSPDGDPTNGSSISCLLEFKGVAALLLADSHPSDITDSLMGLGYSESHPLHADLVQLAHHGSKANTSPAFLDLIKTKNFVITGNGITNRHPDKETLVRILTQKDRDKEPLIFTFPSNTNELTSLFAVDKDPFARYIFSCVYGDEHSRITTFNFKTLNEPAHE